MQRTVGLTVIAILALVQSLLGVLRAFHWFDVGSDLLGQGLLILPIISMFAFARGVVVAVIALLYVLFAIGVFTRESWSWWLGLVLAVVSGIAVLGLLIEGESLGRALLWAIIPVIIVWYLFTPAGRQALDINTKAK